MTSRKWDALDVSDGTRKFIESTKFRKMTPVQAVAIPLFLSHKDVAVEAITGSGKTLTFLIPIFEMLSKKIGTKGVGALIMSPTRELCQQIEMVLSEYLDIALADNRSAISTMLTVGGTDVKSELKQLSEGKLTVLVGTPGRLNHLLKFEECDVSKLEVLVFDEADRLFELGFAGDMSDILAKLPKQRRTGLFSATLTSELKQLMKAGMRNPAYIKISVDKASKKTEAVGDGSQTHAVPTQLTNFVRTMPATERLSFLCNFLSAGKTKEGKTIIFFLSCACVDYFHILLKDLLLEACKGKDKNEWCVEKLHGQMPAKARNKTYKKFLDAKAGVLLCTDVAARGIDIPEVDWVVQFDAPQDPSQFVHRIGRTARAGRSGQTLLFLQPGEEEYLGFLEKRKIIMQQLEDPKLASFGVPVGTRVPKQWTRDAVFEIIRKRNETDREVMLKGNKAFVSFVRAYQEHQLNYIFVLKQLALGPVAMSYGLLRVPRMKEILGRKIAEFSASHVKPFDVPFKDAKREKARLEKAAKEAEEKEKAAEEKAKLQEKFDNEKARTRSDKRKAKRQATQDEWDDLAFEERLAKKLRQGKITSEEFDKQLKKRGLGEEEDGENPPAMGSDSDDSDDDSDAGNKKAPSSVSSDSSDSEDERPVKKPKWRR